MSERGILKHRGRLSVRDPSLVYPLKPPGYKEYIRLCKELEKGAREEIWTDQILLKFFRSLDSEMFIDYYNNMLRRRNGMTDVLAVLLTHINELTSKHEHLLKLHCCPIENYEDIIDPYDSYDRNFRNIQNVKSPEYVAAILGKKFSQRIYIHSQNSWCIGEMMKLEATKKKLDIEHERVCMLLEDLLAGVKTKVKSTEKQLQRLVKRREQREKVIVTNKMNIFNKIEKERQEKENTKEKIEKYTEENKRLKTDTVRVKENQRNTLLVQKEHNTMELEDLFCKCKSQVSREEVLDNKVREIRKKLAEAREKHRQMQKEIQANKDREKELTLKCDKLSKAYNELDAENERVLKELNSVTDEYTKTRETVKGLEAKGDFIKSLIEQKREEIKKLEKEPNVRRIRNVSDNLEDLRRSYGKDTHERGEGIRNNQNTTNNHDYKKTMDMYDAVSRPRSINKQIPGHDGVELRLPSRYSNPSRVWSNINERGVRNQEESGAEKGFSLFDSKPTDLFHYEIPMNIGEYIPDSFMKILDEYYDTSQETF